MMSSNATRYILLLLILTGLFGCRAASERVRSEEQITDIDGNTYSVTTIGNQTWMAENLKTTRFNDGTPIALVEKYDDWAELILPAYCWYNNDTLNRKDFGALYNYYAVESGNLCPEGWHVPSDEEWKELVTTLGGALIAGGALKEEGTNHWKAPNSNAMNNSKFAARPGGYRNFNGTFNLKRTYGFWWSSTEKSWYGAPPRGIYRELRYNDQDIRLNIAENGSGFSVRCIKNP